MARKLISYLIQSYGILAFLFCLLVAFSGQLTSHPSSEKNWNLSQSWFVSPSQALSLREKGAYLFDARASYDRIFRSLPNAKNISWEEFSATSRPFKGKLLSKEVLEKKILSLGVLKNDVILVAGDPLAGWGEEGRIVWTLRSANFINSYIIDGGVTKFLEQSKQKKPVTTQVEISNINAEKSNQHSLDIEVETLRGSLQKSKDQISVLDVREEREFNGATPYGETRGGHIPGAKWIYYKEFIDEDGFIKSKKEITALLSEKNISMKNMIVSYCTGGVRSAFTTSVLLSYGFQAQNYSGSMWEWASKDDQSYPLLKGKK